MISHRRLLKQKRNFLDVNKVSSKYETIICELTDVVWDVADGFNFTSGNRPKVTSLWLFPFPGALSSDSNIGRVIVW